MKAAVYYENGGPEVLRYEDVPDPECPAGWVVIDVEAVSLEGGDLIYRWGSPPPHTPYVVGYQAAGVICQVGEGVSDLEVGQRVTTIFPNGSHAEKRAVLAAVAFPVPDGLSIEEASTIPIPFGTAGDCLFEYGKLQAGETVLVQAGASGVGLAAVQLAKRAGATVFATSSSDEKLERLRDFGLDHGVNYATQDVVAKVMEITGGNGIDVIVDGVGGDVTQASLRMSGYRGRVCMYGNVSRDSFSYKYDLDMMRGNRAIYGVALSALEEQPRLKPILQQLIEDVADGSLRAVVDKTFPLSEAAAAHAYVESRQSFGRVVLIP